MPIETLESKRAELETALLKFGFTVDFTLSILTAAKTEDQIEVQLSENRAMRQEDNPDAVCYCMLLRGSKIGQPFVVCKTCARHLLWEGK